MNRYLHCAEQQESSSNFTKYCTCHAKWLWWLIRVTYETSFTMRGATGVTIQLHQILRLPRKMNLMIDPRLTWNVVYNARSNRNHNPTSPNTAPATQNESHDWSASHMKRHLQCAEQPDSHPPTAANTAPATQSHSHDSSSSHYNARSNTGFHPTSPNTAPAMKFWVQDFSGKSLNCFRQKKDDSRIIRPWSDHMEKCNISRSGYLSKFHQVLRLPRKVTLQLHQILRLPRKMNLMIDPHQIWNVIFTMRGATRVTLQLHQILRLPRKMNLMIDPPHIWTSFTMCGATRDTLQLHQILPLPRNLKFKISAETLWIASANIKTIRGWSEDDPRIIWG